MTMMLRSRIERRPARRRSSSRATIEFARQLCHHHGGPMLAMATLILGDVEAAGEVVVDTLAAASGRGRPVHRGGRRMRAMLATSIYRRCLGRLALRERFPTDDPRPADPVHLAGLTEGQRCAFALTIFSGYSLRGVARTLNLTPSRVVRLLEEVRTMMGGPEPSLVDSVGGTGPVSPLARPRNGYRCRRSVAVRHRRNIRARW